MASWSRLDEPARADAESAEQQHVDLPWESRVHAEAWRGYVVELPIQYSGERPGTFSFFTQFPDIIFRRRGSVLPHIVVEITITIALSLVALLTVGGYSWSLQSEPEDWSHFGHQLSGVLLAFLTVFRTQSSWAMLSEGSNTFLALVTSSRHVAVEVLGSSVEWGVKTGDARGVPAEALEVLRLLKLHLFLCIEHVRSDEGYTAW